MEISSVLIAVLVAYTAIFGLLLAACIVGYLMLTGQTSRLEKIETYLRELSQDVNEPTSQGLFFSSDGKYSSTSLEDLMNKMKGPDKTDLKGFFEDEDDDKPWDKK